LLLGQLSVIENAPLQKKASFWKELHEGWKAFTSNPILWMATIFVIFLNCTMTVVSTTIIFFAKDVLHLSSSLLAVVLSSSGIGGLTGSLLASWLRNRMGLGRIFGMGALLNGVAYLGLYLSAGLAAVMVWLIVIGFPVSMHSISIYTLRHEQTPAHLMGRIGGIAGTLFRLGMPVTMYFSGWMTVWWGASSIFISSAIWNLLAFAVLTRTRLWRLS
jgi:predicted MFS family arabinose efflux permease